VPRICEFGCTASNGGRPGTDDLRRIRGLTIYAGSGDDRVDTTAAGWPVVDCGDGADTARVVAANSTITGCETVTPGQP
jgi:hypothetical protein